MISDWLARPLPVCLLSLLTMALLACGGADESEALQEAIDVGSEQVVSIQVTSPEDKTLFEVAEQWPFMATAVRADNSTFDATERVAWSTSDNTIARIDSSGLLTAGMVDGSLDTAVTARWAHLNSEVGITVSSAELVAIETSVASNPLNECLATTLQASGIYSDGSRRPVSDISWSVSDSGIGRTDGNTLIALSSGTVNVVASREGLTSPPLPVVITDALTGLSFNEGTAINARLGESQQLQVLGTYATTEADITTATAFSSANTTIAEVSDTGLLQALAAGDTSIKAECGGLDETLLVAVVDVAGITIVDVEDDDLEAGESRQLELFKVFSDGSVGTEDLAEDDEVVWDIDSGDEVASISAEGEVTLADDISSFEDTFIRVFAEYKGFEDTLVIRLED